MDNLPGNSEALTMMGGDDVESLIDVRFCIGGGVWSSLVHFNKIRGAGTK